MDSPDVDLQVIDTDKYVDEQGNLKEEEKKKLFNQVISTYVHQMQFGKGKDRKDAADALAELLGKKIKNAPQEVLHGHFDIPPAYLRRVFGEGLSAVTDFQISGVIGEKKKDVADRETVQEG